MPSVPNVMLIDAQRAIRRYEQALQVQAGPSLRRLTEGMVHVPPYIGLCVNLGLALPDDATTLDELSSGTKESRFLDFPGAAGAFRLCYGGLNEIILADCGLANYELIRPTDHSLALIATALEGLATGPPALCETVSGFSPMLVWVQSRTSERGLLSCAFPQFPGAVFFTDDALHYIPRSPIFPSASLYPLQENLYHEALHHRLAETLRVRKIVRIGAEGDTTQGVFVPWRNETWTIERCLHAFVVYVSLAQLRHSALESDGCSQAEKSVLAPALHEALDSCRVLYRGLVDATSSLTRSGLAFVEHLEAQCRAIEKDPVNAGMLA
jgi:hypothetical protein